MGTLSLKVTRCRPWQHRVGSRHGLWSTVFGDLSAQHFCRYPTVLLLFDCLLAGFVLLDYCLSVFFLFLFFVSFGLDPVFCDSRFCSLTPGIVKTFQSPLGRNPRSCRFYNCKAAWQVLSDEQISCWDHHFPNKGSQKVGG